MKFQFLYMCVFLMSCGSTRYQKVVLNYFEHPDMNPSIKRKITMKVPFSTKVIKERYGGEEGFSIYCNYSDSSIIYATSARGGPNPNDSVLRVDQQKSLKWTWPDIISFSGIDKNGKSWMAIKYYDLYYGFSRVPLEKMDEFIEVVKFARIR